MSDVDRVQHLLIGKRLAGRTSVEASVEATVRARVRVRATVRARVDGRVAAWPRVVGSRVVLGSCDPSAGGHDEGEAQSAEDGGFAHRPST